MRRREFITLLGGAAAVWPLAARAQQSGGMPLVGFLNAGSSGGLTEFVAAFHQGLKEAGFVEGQNVAIEYRWADGRNDRLPELAADLVRRQVAVIVSNFPGVLPARAATDTIPIVFLTPGDPVTQGFVTSLNRPGGNVTGISFFNATLGSKRLELLHQMVPRAATIAFLMNPSVPTRQVDLQATQAAARTLALKLRVLGKSMPPSRRSLKKSRCADRQPRSIHDEPSRADHGPSGAFVDALDAFTTRLGRVRRANELRDQRSRHLSSGRRLRGPYPQG
jgi:putative tryptophan/tyrosine transport system substrate-binding protein